MKKKNLVKNLPTASNSLLDTTTNDFEEHKPSFRFPTKISIDLSIKKKRGRPSKLSLKKSSQNDKISPGLDLKENNQIPLKSPTTTNQDDDDVVFLEIESSLSSDAEKLCPSCKVLIPKEEYSNHFSTCLQKFNYNKNVKTQEIIKANTESHPCPICLKEISNLSRSLHIKSCGQAHSLSTEKVILATRLQEKQAEERTSLGLPLLPITENKPASRTRQKKEEKPYSRKGTDPDLDFALALSSSIAEEEAVKRKLDEDKLLQLGLTNFVIQDRRERPLVLPNSSVISTETQGKRSKKGSKKVTPLLVTRTSNERERIVSEKVAALLVSHNSRDKREDPGNIELCKALNPFFDKSSPLWNAAALDTLLMEQYYVLELQDYIECKEFSVGGLLKHLSQIPDRLSYTQIDEDSDDLNEDTETSIVDAYCTQLALAELLGTQEVKDLTFSNFTSSTEERIESDTSRLEVTNGGFWLDAKNDDNGSFNTDSEAHDTNVIIHSDNSCSLNGDQNQLASTEMEENSVYTKISPNSVFDSKNQSQEKSNIVINLDTLPSHNSQQVGIINDVEEIKISDLLTSKEEINKETVDKPLQVNCYSPPSLPKDQESLKLKLMYDWSAVLACSNHSDITLETQDGTIKLHKLVLFTRCPLMFKEAEDGGWEMNWPSISYEVAYAFLVYLYTGQCSIESKENSCWMGIFDLALKYNCQELVQYLEKLYKSSSRKSCGGITRDTLSPSFVSSPSGPCKSNLDCSPITSCRDFMPGEYQSNCDISTTPSKLEGTKERMPSTINTSPDIFDDCDYADISSHVSPIQSPFQQSFPNSPQDNFGPENLSPLRLSLTMSGSEKDISLINHKNSHPSTSRNESTTPVQSNSSQDHLINSLTLANSFKSPVKNHDGTEIVDLTEDSNDSRYSLSKGEIDQGDPTIDTLRKSKIIHEDELVGNHSNREGKTPDKSPLKISSPEGQNKGDDDALISNIWDGFEDAFIEMVPLNSPIHEANQLEKDPVTGSHEISLQREMSFEGLSAANSSSVSKGSNDTFDNNDGIEILHTPQVDEIIKKKNLTLISRVQNQSINNTPQHSDSCSKELNTPYVITPQPDYKSMITPELKKELDKYGIRKMSKNKAIKLLVHIYEQLHPIVTDSEDSNHVQTPVGALRKKSLVKKKNRINNPSTRTRNLSKESQGDPINSSQSSTSSNLECPEESFLELDEEDTESTASQQGTLKNQLKSYILNNKELYQKILLYEPLVVQDLLTLIKASGIKCSMKKLLDFLDEQCITFRFKASGESRVRKRKLNFSKSPRKRLKIS